jgi:subfamily B ATP-binding cassette protein HlyB/CyaB
MSDDTNAIDPGLFALGLLLRLHGVTAEADQIRQGCGTSPIGTAGMLRCAKKFGLSAVIHRTNRDGLAALSPAIAMLRDGFLIVGNVTEKGVVVARPSSQNVELMTLDEFDDAWDGQLLAVARRLSWSDRARRFFEPFTAIFTRALVTASSVEGADGDSVPLEPAPTDPTQSDESGLGALVLLLRIHGIGAEAGQIRHAALCESAWAQGARQHHKMGTSSRNPVTRDRCTTRREISDPR